MTAGDKPFLSLFRRESQCFRGEIQNLDTSLSRPPDNVWKFGVTPDATVCSERDDEKLRALRPRKIVQTSE